MTQSDFAVIVPAYNEAPVIKDLVRELRQAFERHGLDGEVVLVDDGSTDDTAAFASQEADGWKAFKVVRHKTNQGKTEAMITGAASTEKSYLVLFDADLQHSPDEIPRFLERLADGFDIVTGRKIGAYNKRAISSIYNRLSRRVFDVPVSDFNSMKAFHRSVLEGLTLRHDWHRFFVVLAHARGATVSEIDIELLFSRSPFVQEFSGGFSYIRPNRSETIQLPGRGGTHQFKLPQELSRSNVLVEIVGGGQTQTRAYYSHALSVQVIQNYGQVRVLHAESRKPLAAVYVKVYAQLQDGSVKFYKDGYTDLRGRFDYASVSTGDLQNVVKYGLLIASDKDGAMVREATPPLR